MDVLGISAYSGPASAALVRDGRVFAAAREEHFTRRTNDSSFPRNAIAYCLRAGKIGPSSLASVAWCGRPRRAFEHALASALDRAPGGYSFFRRALIEGSDAALDAAARVSEEIDPRVPLREVEELFAHAAGAFYGSPFAAGAVVAIGRGDDGAATMLARGDGAALESIAELGDGGSLLAAADAFADVCGEPAWVAAQTTLRSDAATREIARAALAEILSAREDGSFRATAEFFQVTSGTPARASSTLRAWARAKHDDAATLAFGFMQALAEMIARLAREANRRAGYAPDAPVVLAGTFGATETVLDAVREARGSGEIWRHPAAGAGVEAAGAALLVAAKEGAAPVRAKDEESAGRTSWPVGPGYNSHQIRTYLRSQGLTPDELEPEESVRQIARLLSEGARVGWFEGRLDLGSSPFGSRAILSAPRGQTDSGTRLVSADPVHDALHTTRAEYRRLHDLLRAVETASGRGVLAARSLAAPDGPVACTPEDAFSIFAALGLDAIAMGPYLVTRALHEGRTDGASAARPAREALAEATS